MIFVSVGLCARCNHGGTLYDGLCDRCRPAPALGSHLAHPKASPPQRTLNDLFAALVAEFEEEELAAPLAQRFTLGHIWIDLCRLAGDVPPAHVAALLDEPTHAAPILVGQPETHREPAFMPAD
jgi:hypothetical protein